MLPSSTGCRDWNYTLVSQYSGYHFSATYFVSIIYLCLNKVRKKLYNCVKTLVAILFSVLQPYILILFSFTGTSKCFVYTSLYPFFTLVYIYMFVDLPKNYSHVLRDTDATAYFRFDEECENNFWHASGHNFKMIEHPQAPPNYPLGD